VDADASGAQGDRAAGCELAQWKARAVGTLMTGLGSVKDVAKGASRLLRDVRRSWHKGEDVEQEGDECN
jgi:hypothetical protein